MGLSREHPREDLWRLAEGRLEPARRAEVARHLAGCGACRAELAELSQAMDSLRAMPNALRSLTLPQSAAWPAVWARVQGARVRRMVPRLNLYFSLAVVAFVLAAALPARLAVPLARATAFANQPPIVVVGTPSAAKPAVVAGQESTALAADRLVVGATANPAPTPMPGQDN